jgi:ribosome maturation factor RimP
MKAEFLHHFAKIVEGIVQKHNAFLIDILSKREKKEDIVKVVVDNDAGITIDECAKISHELINAINNAQDLPTAFRLEVSSPGLDKPLKLLRQYYKNIGRPLRIIFKDTDVRKEMKGELIKIENENLTLIENSGNEVKIKFSQIIECKVVLPW